MLLDITNIDSHWSFNGLLWKKRNAPVSCDRGFVIYSIRISIRDTVILLIVYSNGKVFMHFYFSKSKERPLRRQPKVINKKTSPHPYYPQLSLPMHIYWDTPKWDAPAGTDFSWCRYRWPAKWAVPQPRSHRFSGSASAAQTALPPQSPARSIRRFQDR